MKRTFRKNQLIISWVVLVVALCLFFWPAAKLWPALTYEQPDISYKVSSIDDFTSNIDKIRNSPTMKQYSSEHFEFYLPIDYMSQAEANAYIKWVEERRGKVLEYLNHQDVSDDELKIEVFVLDRSGVSFSNGKYFVVYDPKSGLDYTVHELTHSLDWQQIVLLVIENDENEDILHQDALNNFFYEQTAVLAEEEFGAGMAFPNYGMPVDAIIYGQLRQGTTIEPLESLKQREGLLDDNELTISEWRYLWAGSFARYLIETYGADAHRNVMTAGYQGAYQKPLTELEQEWLTSLRVGALRQGIMLSLGGVLVLAIAHLCLGRFWLWLLPVMTSLLAFLSWGYYLSYGDNELWGLVIAVVAGGLFKFWKYKIGVVTLWTLGLLLLLESLIIPAI